MGEIHKGKGRNSEKGVNLTKKLHKTKLLWYPLGVQDLNIALILFQIQNITW